METLFLIFTLAYVTFIWLNTNAGYDYLKFFLLRFKVFQNYRAEWHDRGFKIKFPAFLAVKYPNSFFVKLITCPICFTFWGSVILSILFLNIFWIPILAFCSFFLYISLHRLTS